LYNRLKILYDLQLVDEQLDELAELRGDLPGAVEALKTKMNEIKKETELKDNQRAESLEKRKENEEESEKLNTNLQKFKAQLYNVRNNKEYDALTKEIDHSEEKLKKLETENDTLADLSKSLTDQIEEITPHLKELTEDLKAKEADLKEIIKANEKEEAKLRERRKVIELETRKPDYSAYMRIRNAKGKGVATIKRSACSGCHNIVPPQRQLEIRRNNKLFFCEYCGRILVSPEVAGITED
jgi:hypothetical protein